MNPALRHALVFLGLASLLWLTPKVVFFVRADWHTRRSMFQAWLIRRRWVRLSRMQGLAVIDPTPTLWMRFRYREKAASMRRIVIPRIRVRADAYGVIVNAKTLPRSEGTSGSGPLHILPTPGVVFGWL
jgi:DNA segregation ATPase FtsK/SpoIIIE, S-DNA-T family